MLGGLAALLSSRKTATEEGVGHPHPPFGWTERIKKGR